MNFLVSEFPRFCTKRLTSARARGFEGGNWHVTVTTCGIVCALLRGMEPSNCSSALTPKTTPHPNKCTARLHGRVIGLSNNRDRADLLWINKPLETDLQHVSILLAALRLAQTDVFYFVRSCPLSLSFLRVIGIDRFFNSLPSKIFFPSSAIYLRNSEWGITSNKNYVALEIIILFKCLNWNFVNCIFLNTIV